MGRLWPVEGALHPGCEWPVAAIVRLRSHRSSWCSPRAVRGRWLSFGLSPMEQPRMTVFSRLAHQTALAVALCSVVSWAGAASPIHKCVVDGQVVFQGSPCASGNPGRQPTVDELNAERKKRLNAAPPSLAPSASPSSAVGTPSSGARPSTPAAESPAFRCDGRQHCSQMRSCSEAKYFLAHCPGTKMDGDRDGVPCEEQWCTHPLAR